MSKTVVVEPDKKEPIPYDLSDEEPRTTMDKLTVAGNTAELKHALGAPLAYENEADAMAEVTLLEEFVKNKKKKKGDKLTNQLVQNQNTAFAASAFLRTYGQQLALDVAAARAAVTNKLMEIANCGDTKCELRALELLGKHVDIGLFTSKSEVTINYKDPAELEAAIKERVQRLLNADVIDITPLGFDLDDELGSADELGPVIDEGEYYADGGDNEVPEETSGGVGSTVDGRPETSETADGGDIST